MHLYSFSADRIEKVIGNKYGLLYPDVAFLPKENYGALSFLEVT